MTDLCACAENFLLAVYSEADGLFPYSTRLEEGRFVNDFQHPHTVRYTINSLLGLRRNARLSSDAQTSVVEVDAMIDRFLERQYERIASPADLGLLALLLSDRPSSHLTGTIEQLERISESPRALRRLNLQDLGWILWGASVAGGRDVPNGTEIATAVFDVICSDFVDPRSGLATHSLSRYRRGLVSFGSTVYFLRSAYEYGELTSDTRARRLFVRGVEKMLAIQGPLGEWPWIVRVSTAQPVEFYPVFSVHQDSMAMLFLLPALDDGMPGVSQAIHRSLAWAFGRNELDVPMLWSEPYFAYRSVERNDRFPRPQRYFRAARNIALRRRTGNVSGTKVRLNPECRSYHLGWILYAWAGRTDLPGTEGRRLHVLTKAS